MGVMDFLLPIISALTGNPAPALVSLKNAAPKSKAVNKTNLDKGAFAPVPTNPGPTTSTVGIPNSTNPFTSTFDPLINQVRFAQSIAPFIQSALQTATGGMASSIQGVNQAADQYQANMGNVLSNESLPDNIKQMLAANIPQSVQSTKNVGSSLAASGNATMPYQLLQNAIQAMQQQEQTYLQREQDLQKQLMLSQWAAQQTKQTTGNSNLQGIIQQALQG